MAATGYRLALMRLKYEYALSELPILHKIPDADGEEKVDANPPSHQLLPVFLHQALHKIGFVYSEIAAVALSVN